MSHQEQLYQWNQTLSRHLPCLSKPQADCLALWTLGMVLARSCGLSCVVAVLAALFGYKPNNLRQRLREFYKDAKDKAGAKRKALQVEACFAPLLAWVLSWWRAEQIALAVDATSLGDRFVILVVSVLYRGCAIPVAWRVLQAEQKHAWRKEWLRLLRLLGPAIPRSTRVLVLADRGLYARWLFRRIVRLGWHPLLRVNNTGTFRAEGTFRFQPLWSYAPTPGACWSGRGTAFKSKESQLDCTLLAFWGEGHKDPWLLVTDLPAQNADVCWYGLRTWIEQGFKFLKRSGWQWNRTRMTDPQRAARFWLTTAVATLWLLSLGDGVDASIAEGTFPSVTLISARPTSSTRLASMGIFRTGLICILVHMLRQEPLPQPQFLPGPWPQQPPMPRQQKANRTHLKEAA